MADDLTTADQRAKRTTRRVIVAACLLVLLVVVAAAALGARNNGFEADCRREHPNDPQFWESCVEVKKDAAWP